jgi:uncharacterized membrane protein YdcZ (DUF606 family)
MMQYLTGFMIVTTVFLLTWTIVLDERGLYHVTERIIKIAQILAILSIAVVLLGR